MLLLMLMRYAAADAMMLPCQFRAMMMPCLLRRRRYAARAAYAAAIAYA